MRIETFITPFYVERLRDLLMSLLKKTGTKCAFLLAAVSLAFIYTSCSLDNAGVPATPKRESNPSMAFKRETYSTLSGSSIITIISSDELEARVDGHNIVCKYTRKDDAIRVVMTARGGSVAVYLQVTPNGLKEEDGILYYTPAALEAVKARKEAPSMTIMEFSVLADPFQDETMVKVTLSDVDIKIGSNTFRFGRISHIWSSMDRGAFKVEIGGMNDSLDYGTESYHLYFNDEAAHNKFISEFDKSVRAWRATYATVADVDQYDGVTRS